MWSSLPPQPPDLDLPLEDDPDDADTTPHTLQLPPPPALKINKNHRKRQQQRRQRQKQQQQSEKTTTSSVKTTPAANDASKSRRGSSAFEFLKNDFNNLLSEIKAGTAASTSSNSDADSLSDPDEIGYKSPLLTQQDQQQQSEQKLHTLPPPEEFGYGHPFLLFVALALLTEEREALLSNTNDASSGYEELAMHFDRKLRRHSPKRVLSKAMRLFADYLRAHASSEAAPS